MATWSGKGVVVGDREAYNAAADDDEGHSLEQNFDALR